MSIVSQYSPEDTATYLLYRIGRLVRLQAVAFFKERGIDITPEQWGLLLKIATEPDRPLSNLVDKAFNDYPNVTRLVDGLERQGLVTRAPNPADRRSHVVSATSAGHELLDTFLPELIEAKAEFYDGLDERDIAALLRILKVLEGNLTP